ncbi:hypothetical protein [Synechococcus sp. MIT S9503]|uniref:hypothetical protein n=1 Tax=Synechococcus sp. MIT S9503 TaxID=3082547 RepID=UPI0039A5AD0B
MHQQHVVRADHSAASGDHQPIASEAIPFLPNWRFCRSARADRQRRTMASSASDGHQGEPTRVGLMMRASTIPQRHATAFWLIHGGALRQVAKRAHGQLWLAQAGVASNYFGYA